MTTPQSPDPYGQQPQTGSTPGYPDVPGYTAPPTAGYPAAGAPGQGYPGAPGAGYPGQQAPGGWPAPQGAYPASTTGLPAVAGQRPSTVTTAAVLAFVIGGLMIIGMLVVLSVANVIGGSYWIFAILGLIIAAALIYGGVQLLPGKDSRIIVAAAALIVVVQIINMMSYFVATQLIIVVMAALIIFFCLQPAGKDWVKSRGGTTF